MSTLRGLFLGRRALAVITLASLVIPVGSVNAAGMLVADNGFGGVLQIKQHDVRVTINNGIAVTEVEQIFLNTENRVVEALYTFPVPRGASVSNFSMWINGKEMIGEVVEKQRARQIYESYKQTRRDPGLLEQVNYKRFEMRVFPIAAGAEQRVKITYAQELDYDHNTAVYVYPLATATSPRMDQRTSGRFALSVEAKSEVPIIAMKSPSHSDSFAIAKHAEHYWQASLETREGDLSRDLVVVYQTERPRTGLDLIASKHQGEDGYFLLTLTAGKELESAIKGSDYVFVLDVSGSMAHDGKLSMSRGSIERFLQALGEGDSCELITFNISPRTLFGSLKPVTAQTRKQAVEFLQGQGAAGGTVLGPALDAAYRYRQPDRPLNVVILSDGMTEASDQAELVRLIGRRPAGVTVFCVGVGNEVNRPLLTQLAHNAGGLAAFLSASDDFERQAQAFRRKLTHPAATNVKLTFGSGDVYDLEPATLPNLYHGQPIRLYGRYRNSGPVTVNLKADVLGQAIDQTVDLQLPASEETNPQLDRMWASRRVERLLDNQRSTGSTLHAAEIVRLCEGYSIVSEYASFIVLENDAEYQRWQIERRNATRIRRDQAAQLALRSQLDRLRQQAASQIGPAPTRETAAATAPAAPQASRPVSPPPFLGAPPPPSRGQDSNPFSGGGGGAIDPITGLLGVGLAGLAYAVRRARKRGKAQESKPDREVP
jgi:Ca-activated chloride channel family protein